MVEPTRPISSGVDRERQFRQTFGNERRQASFVLDDQDAHGCRTVCSHVAHIRNLPIHTPSITATRCSSAQVEQHSRRREPLILVRRCPRYGAPGNGDFGASSVMQKSTCRGMKLSQGEHSVRTGGAAGEHCCCPTRPACHVDEPLSAQKGSAGRGDNTATFHDTEALANHSLNVVNVRPLVGRS